MLYNNVLLEPLLNLKNSNSQFVVLEKNFKKLTAGELFDKSKNLAATLSKMNFKKGDVALLAIMPGKEFLIIFYSLIMLRAKIAIIDNEMGKDNYESKMKQLDPKWLFADSRLLFLSKFPALRKITDYFKKNLPKLYLNGAIQIVGVGGFIPFCNIKFTLKKLLSSSNPSAILVDDNNSYENIIIYTSGTLSIPKGVVHTDISLQATLKSLEKLFYQDKSVILAAYLPHFLLLGIACGFSVKLINPTLSAFQKLKWFDSKKITVYFGTPHEYLPLINYCEHKRIKFPDTLQHLIIGSASVQKNFLKKLVAVLPAHIKITCTYGMTEHLITATADGRKKVLYTGKGDLLGCIADEVKIKISETGEILIKSDQLFSRYLHEQTGSTWHSSGDLGLIDEDGNLVLLGRKKDMIIRRDFNIYPALYEDTIKRIPGINEAALIGVYDEKVFDEKVYLVLETSLNDMAAIQKKLKTGANSIDTAALPDTIVKMNIPRCGRHQKIDRLSISKLLQKQFH